MRKDQRRTDKQAGKERFRASLPRISKKISGQFRNNRSPSAGKTIYYAVAESKANQHFSQLPLNSGT
jgi:hypothetical protein